MYYVAEAIVAKRRGAYLAKGDMQSAYNMVHYNLEVHTLLGISYEKGVAILCCFSLIWPMLGSKIFTTIADALQKVKNAQNSLKCHLR